MQTMTSISRRDIDDELVECLPERETLLFDINVAPVIGVNLSIAINAATINSSAYANAHQVLASVIH
jgi:hypothetical protein